MSSSSIRVRINFMINLFPNLKRENDEPITKFNWRFQSFYVSMPMEIRPSERLAMVYYVMAQHLDLVLFMLERKSSSLRQLFEDAKGVEENIRASRRVQDPVYFEDLHGK